MPCQRGSSSSGAQWVPAIDAEELQQQEQYAALLEQAPEELLCPISLQLLTDPVVTPGGVTYNRCVMGTLPVHYTAVSDPSSHDILTWHAYLLQPLYGPWQEVYCCVACEVPQLCMLDIQE
jgi:hypothetical protein